MEVLSITNPVLTNVRPIEGVDRPVQSGLNYRRISARLAAVIDQMTDDDTPRTRFQRQSSGRRPSVCCILPDV